MDYVDSFYLRHKKLNNFHGRIYDLPIGIFGNHIWLQINSFLLRLYNQVAMRWLIRNQLIYPIMSGMSSLPASTRWPAGSGQQLVPHQRRDRDQHGKRGRNEERLKLADLCVPRCASYFRRKTISFCLII